MCDDDNDESMSRSSLGAVEVRKRQCQRMMILWLRKEEGKKERAEGKTLK